jgi:hypothetical protein
VIFIGGVSLISRVLVMIPFAMRFCESFGVGHNVEKEREVTKQLLFLTIKAVGSQISPAAVSTVIEIPIFTTTRSSPPSSSAKPPRQSSRHPSLPPP